jgi:hypothetical protein
VCDIVSRAKPCKPMAFLSRPRATIVSASSDADDDIEPAVPTVTRLALATTSAVWIRARSDCQGATLALRRWQTIMLT